MNVRTRKPFAFLFAGLLMAVPLAACEDEGPIEEAGDAVEEAADEVEEAADEAN